MFQQTSTTTGALVDRIDDRIRNIATTGVLSLNSDQWGNVEIEIDDSVNADLSCDLLETILAQDGVSSCVVRMVVRQAA